MSQFKTQIPNHFSLPRRIKRLGDLAYNLWWAWNPEAVRLFKLIDSDLWEDVYHNPIRFLREIERQRLNAVTYDRYLLDYYDRVFRSFDHYMQAEGAWFTKNYPQANGKTMAYFSMEFGIT
jgi:starch phosphorylase